MLLYSRTKGFTLIELLVVISIIAVLAAILFPVFARAREKARQTTCQSNQRQIAAAVAMYVQDHAETFPVATTVWNDLTIDPGVLKCPTAGAGIANGYLYDGGLSARAIGVIADPTQAFLTVDGGAAGNVANDLTGLTPIHSNKVIASFTDGHVSAATVSQLAIFTPTSTALALNNPSFEYPIKADGLWTGDMSATDWTQTGGSIGLQNSDNNKYLNTGAIAGVDRTLPQPFDSYQMVYINSTGYITQDLAERATPGMTYTLKVGVGCSLNSIFPSIYNVELLFNGVSKSTTTYPSSPPANNSGQVSQVTATYTAVEADRNAVIRVKLSATVTGGSMQMNFDNVRVTKAQN